MDDVPEVETAACKDGPAWARQFIARNPTAHTLDVLSVYGKAELTSRLGPLGIDAVEGIQAEMCAGGLTPEKLAVMKMRRVESRAAREKRHARFLHLTADELCALPDAECARAVAVRLPDHRGDARSVSAVVRHARAALHLHAEVCNGGFDQFWLRALGAVDATAVVERAISLAREKYPRGIRASNKSGRDPDFDPLDQAYYAALPRRTPGRSFEAYLAAYVRARAHEF
jgi:hypothetical protein